MRFRDAVADPVVGIMIRTRIGLNVYGTNTELERLKPAELLVSEGARGEELARTGTALRTRPPWHFELASASRLLTDQLGTLDLKGFGVDDLPLAICAAGALLQYVRDTQKSALPHIRSLHVEERTDTLILDAATRRNLELDASLSGNGDATLCRDAALESMADADRAEAFRLVVELRDRQRSAR